MGMTTLECKALQERLNNMAKKASSKEMDKVLDKGDKIILESMRETVPKDTGELHDSLGKIKRIGSGFNRTSVIGIATNDRKVIERGYYQEYGTRHMMGSNWIERGFQRAKGKAVTSMKDELKRNLMR